jgi:hypothetical protein
VVLKQRSDYTHKHNSRFGRHGWLRLTPAYSLKVVEEILLGIPQAAHVLDPFCGTATTALCATYRGHRATTTEINPFLVWFGGAKLAHYSQRDIDCAMDAARRAVDGITRKRIHPVAPPPLHNIERWWEPAALEFLCGLRSALDSSTQKHEPARALLDVAFCRTLIKVSNAAFNHQSMSFRDRSKHIAPLGGSVAMEDVQFVLRSALDNPAGEGRVVHGDACAISSTLSGRFDAVITSPPYPNRMSYIRELRPYMYWLGFLGDSRSAAELDWASIGGTWGVATSRLNNWQPSSDGFCPRHFKLILNRIASDRNPNGRLLSNYVAKYFHDMFRHLRSLTGVLSPGATTHYIVGNSSFYGVLVPAEELYAEMFHELGFDDVRIRPIRKRNSKRELVEFEVSARWRA